MNNQSTFTITQINKYIKNLIETDRLLGNIWLKGEISNFKPHTSGHMYLTLKDEGSVLQAVMFKSAASSLTFKPQNGMKVIVKCNIRVYEPMGGYQAYISEMSQDGLGDLHIAYEMLKQKLSAEGLFDNYRKKPLPHFPERIGIVTSPTGAAIKDMLNILNRRCKYPEIFIYPVLVQGPDAPSQIIEGIEYFNKTSSVDVIITGRGGGSIEDLWAFNDEGVARCIAASSIPVISAVGHEIDFTIADFVADLRAATPSEAAERVISSTEEFKTRIKNAQDKIYQGLKDNASSKRMMLEQLGIERVFTSVKNGIDDKKIKIDDMFDKIKRNMDVLMERKNQQLKMSASGLNNLSPLAVLGRGYSITFGKKGKAVVSVTEIKKGENITIKLSDGVAGAKIETISEN